MSCPSSAQALHPAHDPAALAAALVSVAERSFFAYAEATAPDDVVLTAGAWYEARVSFQGPFSGSMTLALPAALAHELYVAFLGLEADAAIDADAVRDLVGELANMACGSWLTGVHATSCFDLTHPDVQAIETAPPTDIVVMINDQPVAMALQIAPGTP
jgi:hypothetical protein